MEFSLVGTRVTCAVQIEILVSLAGIYHDRSAADHWILFRPVYRSVLATHGFLFVALECGNYRGAETDIKMIVDRAQHRLFIDEKFTIFLSFFYFYFSAWSDCK